MAGHIQDRWWRDAKDENGKAILDRRGKPLREKTDLYGKWERYKVRYIDPDGRERSKTFPDRQLRRAQAFLATQQNDVLSGTYLDPAAGSVTFRDFSTTVMMGRSRDESSVQTWSAVLRNLVYPFLGTKSLVYFSADLIRRWLGWMNEKDGSPAQSYQRQAFDLVCSILDAAVSDRRIRVNPCRDKSITRPAVRRKVVVPWSEAKMRKIELALPPRSKIVVPLGAGLGLRQGEILAFSMDYIDRRRMIYRCARQLVKVGSALKFKLPKGHKEREIPLGRGVLEKLDAYADNYPAVPVTLPWGEQDGRDWESVNLLISDAKSQPVFAGTFNAGAWIPAFGRAGFEYHPDNTDGMHALRHLYASALLHEGVSIKELAAFLGHADEALTLRTYVHLMPNSYTRAATAVDAIFAPGQLPAADEPDVG